MKKITEVSRKFRILFQILFYLLPLLLLWFWLVFHGRYDVFTSLGIGSNIVSGKITVTFITRVLGFLVSLIPLGIIMYVLHQLVALFKSYEQEQIFTLKNVGCYRKLGYALFAWVIGGLIYDMLISLVLTFQNPPGQRFAAFTFSGIDFVALITGGVVLLISWVMKEAHKLSEEQTLTI